MSEALIVRRGGSGGGAGGYNFAVKAYSAMPTGTAAENTIGVVIDNLTQPMTGWVMQAEAPIGTPGLVWIEVATESDVAFYADKKGFVKLYPIAVQQHDGEKWSGVEAYIYQNGWQQFSSAFDGWLYYLGETYDDVTGGWKVSSSSGSLTENDDNLFLKSTTGNETFASTTNPIDTRGFSMLEVAVKTSSSAVANVGIGKTNTEYDAKQSVAGAGSAYKTYTVPLDDTQGDYYVMFSTSATNAGLYVNSIRLT